jgi:predicted RNA-binding protein YlxR (DUF448 family)
MQAGELRTGRSEPGRGAWLCSDERCFDSATQRRAFGRALRTDVDAAQIAALKTAFVDQQRRARG